MGRINLASLGYLVCQFFDKTDPDNGAKYDETTGIRAFGARFEWVKDTFGLPTRMLQTVANTYGPIGGWISWPPKTGGKRKLAQLAQVFPAKITSTGPLKATPVKTGDGTGWQVDTTDLDEIAVFTQDGSSPAVGTFGIVVVGSDLFGQAPLFFQGGGGGDNIYRITTNNNDGTYVLQQYDYPGGTAGTAGIAAKELNLAKNVPQNNWVKGSSKADGNVWFNAPYGC